MEVTGHTTSAMELVVDVVNELSPGHARGRPVVAPTGGELRTAVATSLVGRPNRARDWDRADDAEHERLRVLARRWRAVVTSAGDGVDVVAPLVDDLLRDAPVAPRLVEHDGEPWHLHAHADDAGPAAALAATAALALAELVADGDIDRLGVCDAAACDRVYVDTSRNASRRFCSGACQARAKTAAYRARRA